MERETEYAILFREGRISCRNFGMAYKMFRRLKSAVMLLSLDLATGRSVAFRKGERMPGNSGGAVCGAFQISLTEGEREVRIMNR